ncbi:MAG: VIT1/CCC1 transporter family protein [Actinomycetota bacterium]|nr:VIT1/CCC1 transporter family protein [Actinomycetota bacterium]
MATKTKEPRYLKRFREFWESEISAAWLYRSLAEVADEEGAATLKRLADAEDRHAAHWAALLQKSGGVQPTYSGPPFRERVLARIARRFGLESVLPILVRLEAADARKYVGVPEAPTEMGQEEVQHGRSLATIGKNAPSRIADIESRHRVSSGGVLRAATFGINDGLVSNLSLIMGVAGGTGNAHIILLAGVAGLFAGAFSMGSGEWISVKSQRELYEREIEIERHELEAFPDEERDELALIYRTKGIEPGAAEKLAERIMLRPSAALDTLAREELGLDPSDLASPWVAAISSFVAFAIGAFIPVLPYLFMTGGGAILLAAVLSGIALSLVGLGISILTGRSGFVSAFRMLFLGAASASITYGVGSLVGASIS